MSRLIDFEYTCIACKTKGAQACAKPTTLTPTVGWITCQECLCRSQIRVSMVQDKEGDKKITIELLHIHRSKRYKDKIAAQKERDAAAKASV